MYIPHSREEEEFLKNYDPAKYQNPAVAVDCVIFAYDSGNACMKTLFIKRGGFPYKGYWCFPGGFVNIDEHLHDAVAREVQEETGISGIYCDMYYTMGAPGRDPRYRVITPEYIALVNIKDVKADAGDDAAEAQWLTIADAADRESAQGDLRVRDCKIRFEGKNVFEPHVLMETAYNMRIRRTVKVVDDAGMAFDHAKVAVYAFWRLKDRLLHSDMAYQVLPKEFSLDELKALFYSVFFEDAEKIEYEKLPYVRRLSNGNYTYLP